MDKFTATKKILLGMGMIQFLSNRNNIILFAPDKSFKYAAVILNKQEINESNKFSCISWEDFTNCIGLNKFSGTLSEGL